MGNQKAVNHLKSDFFKKDVGCDKLSWKLDLLLLLFRGLQSKGKNRFLAITFHRVVRSSPYFYCRLVSWVLNFLCGLLTVALSIFSKIMDFPGCCSREFSQNTHSTVRPMRLLRSKLISARMECSVVAQSLAEPNHWRLDF